MDRPALLHTRHPKRLLLTTNHRRVDEILRHQLSSGTESKCQAVATVQIIDEDRHVAVNAMGACKDIGVRGVESIATVGTCIEPTCTLVHLQRPELYCAMRY